MKHCIPDSLLNRISYPDFGHRDRDGDTTGTTGKSFVDKIIQEMRYKISIADDLVLRKELWHTICDFCGRTGALLERSFVPSGDSVEIWREGTDHGRFMYVVGCYIGEIDRGRFVNGVPTTDFYVADDMKHVFFTDGVHPKAVVYSVRPEFSDSTGNNGKWDPLIPEWFVIKYGECIMHGALMRLFVMSKPWYDFSLARMHAIAYNNDLTRLSFGLITSGMRKHLLIDVEDMLAKAVVNTNGNS